MRCLGISHRRPEHLEAGFDAILIDLLLLCVIADAGRRRTEDAVKVLGFSKEAPQLRAFHRVFVIFIRERVDLVLGQIVNQLRIAY